MSEDLEPQTIIKQAKQLFSEIPVEKYQQKLSRLQKQTLDTDFWNKPNAQSTMQEISWLEQKISQAERLTQLSQDLKVSLELAADAEEKEQKQLIKETKTLTQELSDLISELRLAKYLSGRYDQQNAILSIHPGQGGTEAMDWASMLQRMYQRYFERQNWKYSLISEIPGEEAGIKEAVYEVQAPYAYGYLKGERGTHRLVRLSPFNADNLRQTSFALVEVMPVIEDDPDIELKEEDLSWHFTRSGGPGGQSVNKTNSAVELTHESSGITVKSRQSRSQVQNKETALKMLKAQLARRHEQKLQEKIEQEKGAHKHASWGTQIRNYVLHPYQLVKDTRTEVETSDAEAVLDGALDQFIKEEIKLST